MSHYRPEFPTATIEKETDSPCPKDPENKKHRWEKNTDLSTQKTPEGYQFEAHPWVCRNCEKTVWVPKGIELK